MQIALVASGHGYDNPTIPGRERCTAWDGYEILAEPLGGYSERDRARRVFGRDESGHGGVCYGSHVFKLARREGTRFERDIYILAQNGSGRTVWRWPLPFDRGAMLEALLAMPEQALYGVLRASVEMADNARQVAIYETEATWREAARDGRIRRRSYPSRGKVVIWIEPARKEGESEENWNMRKRFAAPSKL